MRCAVVSGTVLLCVGLLAGSPARASDDLVRAAKRERARREALKKEKAKQKKPDVVTSTDLAGAKGGSISVTGKARPVTPKEPVKPAPSGSAAAAPAEAKPEKKGEEYWRGRVQQASQNIETAESRVKELEALMHKDWRKSRSIDDPAQRHKKGIELDQTRADLKKARQAVHDAQQELDSVREEGRRAGAYAGWLR